MNRTEFIEFLDKRIEQLTKMEVDYSIKNKGNQQLIPVGYLISELIYIRQKVNEL